MSTGMYVFTNGNNEAVEEKKIENRTNSRLSTPFNYSAQ